MGCTSAKERVPRENGFRSFEESKAFNGDAVVRGPQAADTSPQSHRATDSTVSRRPTSSRELMSHQPRQESRQASRVSFNTAPDAVDASPDSRNAPFYSITNAVPKSSTDAYNPEEEIAGYASQSEGEGDEDALVLICMDCGSEILKRRTTAVCPVTGKLHT